MVVAWIYRATFETSGGQTRRYVGHTTSLENREASHLFRKKPLWLREGKLKVVGQKADQKWGRYMTPIFAKRCRYCAVACVHCGLEVARHRRRRQDLKHVSQLGRGGRRAGAYLVQISGRACESKGGEAVDRQRVAAHGAAPSRTLGCILP